MKKKFVFILTALMLCLCFAFSSCGETRGDNNKDDDTPTDTLTFERDAAGEGYIVTGDKGEAANIVIPAAHESLPVVGIADGAFAYSKHTSDILSVVIPDSVVEIGKNAFHN